MYRPEAAQSREALEEMQAVFGSQCLQTVITYDEVVAEAPAAGQALLDFAPQHSVTLAYQALAEEVLSHGG
jgi:cellulose biosynthesis protein BcsQ